MQHDKREKIIAIVLGIVALGAIGCVVWMTQSVYGAQEEIAKNNQELVQKQAEQVRLTTLAALADTLLENRERVAGQFVTLDNEVVFIEAIETSARESDVSLEITRVNFEDIELESEDEAGNKKVEKIGEELVLVLDATGSWREVFQFVSLVETLALGLNVRHTQLRIIDDPEIFDKWGSTMIIALRVRNK